MRHTTLTIRNFGEFAVTSVTLGLLSTGFGAVDLAMVAPFGASHIAAVGLGELIVATHFAVLFGYFDLFGTKLAQNEGADASGARLPTLLHLYGLAILTVSVLFLGASFLVRPALTAAYSESKLVWPVSAYVIIRFATVGLFMVYVTSVEALKICGLKSFAFTPALIGFGLNIAGNALFLYTPLRNYFWNIEAAVACSTAIAQLVMALFALLIYFRKFPLKPGPKVAVDWPAVKREYPSFMVSGFSIGSRNLNDYVCNLVPLLFIGAMGTEIAAAAAVATKIATLFYRVPQGCFGASLVFYSYALGRPDARSATGHGVGVWQLIAYSAAPTAVVALVVLVFSRELIWLFGNTLPIDSVVLLLSAYFVFLPVYFFEHFFGELLAAHQRDLIIFRLSTCATILIAVPFSYFAAFHLESAFLAIAGRGLAAIPLAVGYWLCLRPHLRYEQAA
jgi:MATE family multidrug resistance protein